MHNVRNKPCSYKKLLQNSSVERLKIIFQNNTDTLSFASMGTNKNPFKDNNSVNTNIYHIKQN